MPSEQGEIFILMVCQRTMASELFARELGRSVGLRVIAHAETVDESLQAAQSKSIDVALINVTLKDGPLTGFEAMQKMAEARPGIRSVILLEQGEGHLSKTAFRAGAKGVFCTWNAKFESLCHCVKQVNAGQIWANSAQLQEVMEAFARPGRLPIVSAAGEPLLTKREVEVAHLVEEGMTNRQIAYELGLSEHTVRNNLFHIFDKLGISSRVELALYAVNQVREHFVRIALPPTEDATWRLAKGIPRGAIEDQVASS